MQVLWSMLELCIEWCWYFQVGKPAAFVVNYNGASKGKLRARVISPSGTEEEALIQEIDDGRCQHLHQVRITIRWCVDVRVSQWCTVVLQESTQWGSSPERTEYTMCLWPLMAVTSQTVHSGCWWVRWTLTQEWWPPQETDFVPDRQVGGPDTHICNLYTYIL